MMFKYLIFFALCSNALVWGSPISSEAGVGRNENEKKVNECHVEQIIVEQSKEDNTASQEHTNTSNQIVEEEKVEEEQPGVEDNTSAVDDTDNTNETDKTDETETKETHKIRRVLKDFHDRVKNAVEDLIQRKHKKIMEIFTSLKDKAKKFWKKSNGDEVDVIAKELLYFN